MIRGYDERTGHTFTFRDKKPVYEGRQKNLEDKQPCPWFEAEMLATRMTCTFPCEPLYVFLSDECYKVFHWSGKYVYEKATPPKNLEYVAFVKKPKPDVLDRYPNAKAYALNIGDAHDALGFLFYKVLRKHPTTVPKHYWFLKPFEHRNPYGFGYERLLQGDAAGKIAHCCATGTPALNRRYSVVRDNGFDGNFLLPEYAGKDTICLVEAQNVETLLPRLSISWRYAAMCSPMRIDNEEPFEKATGIDSKRITLRVVSANDSEDITAFMQFWNIITGGKLVAFSHKQYLPKLYNRMALFHYFDYCVIEGKNAIGNVIREAWC